MEGHRINAERLEAHKAEHQMLDEALWDSLDPVEQVVQIRAAFIKQLMANEPDLIIDLILDNDGDGELLPQLEKAANERNEWVGDMTRQFLELDLPEGSVTVSSLQEVPA